MRELAILTFVTLDGVVQSPGVPEEDTSGGFTHGGWAAPYWQDVMPVVDRVAMSDPYDMLFGRKTYDIFSGHWPNAPQDGLSDRINAARKYVVTSDPETVTWQNAHPITGDPIAGIRALKAQDGPLLQVHGSAQLIQFLLANDFIDEMRLVTFPLILGQGKRLFEPGCAPRNLDLSASRTCGSDVTMQIYRNAASNFSE